MNKISKPYLDDITKSVQLIEKYLTGKTKDVFFQDYQLQDAVIRRLEIIGEATKHLEENFKQTYPQIPWKKMAGMRDILIHDYDEVDLELIWDVLTNYLPDLKEFLSKLSQ